METFQELGEFGFIDRIAQHKQGGDVLCGIGDDCAVFALDAEWVRLVTTDMMMESIHFTRTAAPEGLGYKLLAVNLSDVAAMGGTPTDARSCVGMQVQSGGFRFTLLLATASGGLILTEWSQNFESLLQVDLDSGPDGIQALDVSSTLGGATHIGATRGLTSSP